VERVRVVTYMPQTLPQGVTLTVIEAVMTARRAAASRKKAKSRFTPRPMQLWSVSEVANLPFQVLTSCWANNANSSTSPSQSASTRVIS
jgi:hypothetical protein